MALAFAVPLAALWLASAALAGPPTGEYEVFKECPLSVPKLTSCIYSLTTSGEVKIGSTSTQISDPITLQGGTVYNTSTELEAWQEAANGETLSHSPQPVEGGLLGIVAPESLPTFLRELITKLTSEGLAGVDATTELVGSPQYNFAKLSNEKGVGLVLPVRIHLENSLLGSECYIGSVSEPVTLNLTTGKTSPPGPNEPISGTAGTVSIKNNGNLVVASDDSAVDNSFSVPVAQGCGSEILFGLLTSTVDEAVNLKLGLPSAAGKNTARLSGTLEQANPLAVVRSGESAKEIKEKEEKEEKERKEREEKEKREREEKRKKIIEEEEEEEGL